jgi:fatty acyl-ACP thioesterase A
MLKVSCNVLNDQIQAVVAQCGFLGRSISMRGPGINPRRNSVVLGSASNKAPVVLAVVSDRAIGSGSGSAIVADRLRLGSLTEDGLSYKERFIVRSYEVGINKTATVETIANLLQVFF